MTTYTRIYLYALTQMYGEENGKRILAMCLNTHNPSIAVAIILGLIELDELDE